MLKVVGIMIPLLVAGCTILPNVGPSANDVAAQAGTEAQPRYEILDIDPSVVEILQRRKPDSFLARFGDYRPSVDPVLGVGDFVTITIWEAGAGGLFSAPLVTDRFTTGSKSATIPEQAVTRQGTVTVPYAGEIKVAGRSTTEVQQDIVEALQGKAIQPQVIVTVTRPVSNTVTVTGEVTAGARVPLTLRGDRLLDVVAAAGGVRAPVHETFVQLMRGRATARVALSRVLADPRENIFMRPGDVLTLVREPQVFLAYGATGRNAEIPFESTGVTLAEALVKAGGLLDFRSDPAGVFVFRYEPSSVVAAIRPGSAAASAPGTLIPVVYRLNMRDSASFFAAKTFPIFDKDVLYVSNAPLSDVQKALQVFNTVTSPVRSGIGIYSGVN